MIATRDATEIGNMIEGAQTLSEDDEAEAPPLDYVDRAFGNTTECAEDALFVKRISLIIVPVVLLLCLMTQILAHVA